MLRPSSCRWGDELVHLDARGHRLLGYRVAEVLGAPHAEALSTLDAAFQEHERISTGRWWLHARPWIWRRLRRRTAGDGRSAKHDGYVDVGPAPARRDVDVR